MFKKELKKLGENKYLLLFLFFVLLVFIINFRYGHFVIGNDNYSPEIDPKVNLQKQLLAPGFREYRAFGVPSDTEQADIYRSLLFYASSFVLPNWLISQLYLYLGLITCITYSGKFAYFFLKKHVKRNDKALFILTASFFYFFNLVGIWIFFSPTHQFFSAFCFFPAVVYYSLKTVKKASIQNVLLLSIFTLLSQTAALTATTYLVLILLNLSFIATYFWFENKRSPVNLVIAVMFFLILNLYWLVPFFLYVFSNTSDLATSLIYRKITPDLISSEAASNNILNSISYKFSWLEAQDNNKVFIYKFALFYLKNFYTTIYPILISLSIIIGLYISFKNRVWSVTMLFLIYLTGLYFIKGQNPPLEQLFLFLQDTFPTLFAQVFRWTSSKLWPLMIFTVPIIAAFTTVNLRRNIIERKHRENTHIGRIFPAIILTYLALFSFPIFLGYLIGSNSFVKMPKEYYEVAMFLNNNQEKRVLILPESNTNYFRQFSFGFWGSGFLHYQTLNPLVEKALTIGAETSENLFYQIRKDYYSNNTTIFTETLNSLDIEYILVDKNIARGIGYNINNQILDNQTKNNPNLNKVYETPNLSVYQIKQRETKENTLNGVVYLNNVQRLDLNSLQPISATIVDDHTIINYVNQQFINLTGEIVFKKNDLLNFPTKFNFSNNTLAATPTGPKINNNSIEFESIVFEYNSIKGPIIFYTVNNNVYRYSDNLQTSETINNVLLNTPTIWTSNNISTNDLIQSTTNPLYCENGKEYNNLQINQDKNQCRTSYFFSPNMLSIPVLEMQINTDSPVIAEICLYSEKYQKCINSYNKNLIIYNSILVKTHSDYIVPDQDELQLFVDLYSLKEQSAKVNIVSADLKFFTEQNFSTKTTPANFSESYKLTFPVKSSIELKLPILQGPNTRLYTQANYNIPEYYSYFYNKLQNNPEEKIDENSATLIPPDLNGLITTKNSNSNSTLVTPIDNLSSLGASLLYIKAKNTQGIPADIYLKPKESDYPIFEQKLYPKTISTYTEFSNLEQGLSSYKFEFFTQGHGIEESLNTIDQILIQPIPSSWAKLSIKSNNTQPYNFTMLNRPKNIISNTFYSKNTNNLNNTDEKDVYYLPVSTSPYWLIKQTKLNNNPSILEIYFKTLFTSQRVETEKVVVNEYAQGWILKIPVENNNSLVVIFWPNLIIYAGYLLNIIIVLTLTLLYILKRKNYN